VIAAFALIAPRIQADIDSLPDAINYHSTAGATTLDNTSVAQYLTSIGATGWLYDLLDVAYRSEYGIDCGDQSALNFLELISADTSTGTFDVFGSSDESYKVQGGNQRVVDAIAGALGAQVQLDNALAAIRPNGAAFDLVFAHAVGSTTVTAEMVVLALPFTMLRLVDFSTMPWTDIKKKSINELGYGTNIKLMGGFSSRIWRASGASGYLFGDTGFQSCWDSSQLQPGHEGSLTIFMGGTSAVAAALGGAAKFDQFLLGIETAFPGVTAARNGNTSMFDWPSFAHTKGSYASYKVGQWTTIGGAEIEPVGNVWFAGEHCSSDFQGYMNGGAETGRRAAEAIIAKVTG
jgi:monoamine oxidase